MLLCLYVISILGLLATIGIVVFCGLRKRLFKPFSTLELATRRTTGLPLVRGGHSLADWFSKGARLGRVGLFDSVHHHLSARIAIVAKAWHRYLTHFWSRDSGATARARDQPCLVALLFMVCRKCGSPVACYWAFVAILAGNDRNGDPSWNIGLFVYVFDPRSFFVAPVL